jgi:hypothetical protein
MMVSNLGTLLADDVWNDGASDHDLLGHRLLEAGLSEPDVRNSIVVVWESLD